MSSPQLSEIPNLVVQKCIDIESVVNVEDNDVNVKKVEQADNNQGSNSNTLATPAPGLIGQ